MPRGAEYDARFDRLARAGHDVHGEASFVMGFQPATVLDAGCGTGRVAIELHRRGVEVVGVDLDRSMLETACEKQPDIEWYRSDLSSFLLPGPDDASVARQFDLVVAAGNAGYVKGKNAPGLANPARNPYVIAVGGVDNKGTSKVDDDVMGDYSSSGIDKKRSPDFVAPANSILKTR